MARLLVQTGLPHSRPASLSFVHTNGSLSHSPLDRSQEVNRPHGAARGRDSPCCPAAPARITGIHGPSTDSMSRQNDLRSVIRESQPGTGVPSSLLGARFGWHLFQRFASASLMLGWTFLLPWADRRPVERRGVLLLTAFPVLVGLGITGSLAAATGATSALNLAPVFVLEITLLTLMISAYVAAGRLAREGDGDSTHAAGRGWRPQVKSPRSDPSLIVGRRPWSTRGPFRVGLQ